MSSGLTRSTKLGSGAGTGTRTSTIVGAASAGSDRLGAAQLIAARRTVAPDATVAFTPQTIPRARSRFQGCLRAARAISTEAIASVLVLHAHVVERAVDAERR